MAFRPRIGVQPGSLLAPMRDVLEFRGRATRTEAALFALLSQLLAALLSLLLRPIGLALAADVAWAALSLPLFALAARRLHDIGVPGWPGPLLVGAALILRAAHGTLLGSGAEAFAGAVTAVVLLAALLGAPMPGANRFGADPRAATRAALR